MTIDQINLKDIYDFMETGNPTNAPDHIVAYLDLLDMVRGMFLRMDRWGSKEAIIKHLMVSSSHKLSRYKAMQVCDEAQEYFYRDSQISKSAWKNIYADKMEKMINFAMLTVKDVNDAQKVVKMLLDVSVLRGVNEPDIEVIPDHFYEKPINLLSYDARIFEFGETNRPALNKFIDSLPELTEREKIRIKQEALLLPLKVFPNESENPRKQ